MHGSVLLQCNKAIYMFDSLVDYVLQRGKVDYGEFAPRKKLDSTSTIFNHRKLLLNLFEQKNSRPDASIKKISDLKIEEIAGQLNYFSQKIHSELSKKHLDIGNDLYKLEKQWLHKKMPDFYCYYFLKFAYANTYSRMHQLFLSETENMLRQRDSYTVIKKTIQAREICLANLRRELHSLNDLTVQEFIQTLVEESNLKARKRVRQQNSRLECERKGEDVGKSWKNKLQIVFEAISHLRKLSCYTVDVIKNWKTHIYSISDDPRRFRERVIFFHNQANYLLKMLFDSEFVSSSVLQKYLTLSDNYDPFLLKPVMVLENKSRLCQEEEVLYKLIKPTDLEINKMAKALVIMAQQDYDEGQQSKFIHQKSNYGTLEQRKQMIEKRKGNLSVKERADSTDKQPFDTRRHVQFATDKKPYLTQNELQGEKIQFAKKTVVHESAKKTGYETNLQKIAPYLSKNEKMGKVQKKLGRERSTQSDYMKTVKNGQVDKLQGQFAESHREMANSRIFNRYIEENLRLLQESRKKPFLYKNKIGIQKNKTDSEANFNRISYEKRKELQYDHNLQNYLKSNQNYESPARPRGDAKGKAVIEISDHGVRNTGMPKREQVSNRSTFKNVGTIVVNRQMEKQLNMINNRLGDGAKGRVHTEKKEEQPSNLFQSQKQADVIIMRQQPEKIEELKQFLYNKIKQQLMEEMRKNEQVKENQINAMVEEEKRRKIQQIISQRQEQELKVKQEAEKILKLQLQKERKKIDIDLRIQPIQYAQQNIDHFFQKVFSIDNLIFERLFTNETLAQIKESIMGQLYYVFFYCYKGSEQVGYCIVHYKHTAEDGRKWVIDYLVSKQFQYYTSTLHQVCLYIWRNDPAEQIEITMFKNQDNTKGNQLLKDINQYALINGEVFSKQLYSNILQMKFVLMRPPAEKRQFQYCHQIFGNKLLFRAELLSSNLSLQQRFQAKIDLNLEIFTHYIFLLQQLFRCYLTPEEVVQLRENSTNIRRLKDIFRVMQQLEHSKPVVNQLKVVQGLNLEDLYDRLKDHVKPPYEKYYWPNFYDRTPQNRIFTSILEISIDFQFPITSCQLDGRRFMRISPNCKILTLRSSIYALESIYILETNHPKIRVFMMGGDGFKLMRIELFVFLNLLFNNIVEDMDKFVNSFWVPQFNIGQEGSKQVRRITDFSISMKKSFFLAEEIYFCNYQYIKSGVSLIPRQSDVIFSGSLILGFLHTEVEKGSTGMPIYAKLIDKAEMF